VREALTNVISHAGTGEAWVEISLAAPGANQADHADSTEPTGLLVIVRDAGAGFDPALVDPARLGLRRSITERITDWGGRAAIRSAPGEGTVVSLGWTAPEPADQQAVPVGSFDQGGLPW
jgi:signal transduction histidine kinase